MRLISVSSGKLLELGEGEKAPSSKRALTGIGELDRFFGGGIARAAVHELLFPPQAESPMFLALLLAKKPEAGNPSDVIVISDPKRLLYPPAAVQLGIPLSRLYLLHPDNRSQELWAIGECLASAGVSAVVAELGSLTQVEARRLQLAAERGRTLGVFMRPAGKASSIYAAATRTLVTAAPMPSTGQTQGWMLQLLHGHGHAIGSSLLLEYNREEHSLHTTLQLAHHAGDAKTDGTKRRASA